MGQTGDVAIIHALRRLSRASRQVVDELFATPEPTDDQIARVIGIVREEGGLEYARQRGDEYAERAEAALASVPHKPARSALFDTLTYILDRRS